MPPHYVAWHKLPGYKTLLTCLLLEMKGRPVAQYPEPLVKLTNQLLVCTHLHSLLVKIVFCKVDPSANPNPNPHPHPDPCLPQVLCSVHARRLLTLTLTLTLTPTLTPPSAPCTTSARSRRCST